MMKSRASALFGLAIATMGFSSLGNAAQPEECPLFFPDFRCDRSGRYEGFVMPISQPYLFEDPFITTGAQGLGIWHDFPNDSMYGGGDGWLGSFQVRVAITDRLAVILTKAGKWWFEAADDDIWNTAQGWLDIGLGLKYALIDWPEHNFILSPSIRYEIASGERDVMSGHGDGIIMPALSSAWGIGKLHFTGAIGGRVPFDRDLGSTSIFYHLQVDYGLHKYFVPLIALNGTHWTSSGDGTLPLHRTIKPFDPTVSEAQAALGTGRFEGADLVNLGSKGVGGNDLVTLAFGARIPITDYASLGAIYELPVTSREDIFNQRVTMSLLLEF